MYSIVLLAALTAGENTPDFGWRGGCGCSGYSWGTCYGGCYGSCYGGYGCSGYGCSGYGCGGGWGMPYAGYAPAGYACWGCCGGYSSPAYGYPVPMVVGPGVPGKMLEKKKGPEEEQVSASDRAKLIVEMPADAKLYVDDRPVSSATAKKTFRTPTLKPGQQYFYEVRAEVVRDGKPVSETRRVIVKAGAVIRADFRSLGETPGIASAKGR